jgi:predicted component of type VI protein secretion system
MIREELSQVESNLTSAVASLEVLRARAVAGEKARHAEPTTMQLAMGHSFVDLRPMIHEAEQRIETLTERRSSLAAQVAASEATPEVRAARAKLEAVEREARAADAVAVRVLREEVVPALDRLREAHAKVLAAVAEVRRVSVDLAASRGEPIDFGYTPSRMTFGDLPLPTGPAGVAMTVQVLVAKEVA